MTTLKRVVDGVLASLRGAARLFRARQLVRQAVVAFGFGGATLATNLITGVLIARLLGPQGRGQVTAIVTLVTTIGAFTAFGARASISYHIAVAPTDGPRLLAGWLLTAPVVAAVGVATTLLLLPTLFAAQSASALHAARLYTIVIVAVVLMEVVYGVFQGYQRFVAARALMFLQPAAVALGYAAVALSGRLTVSSALLVSGGTTCAAPVIALVLLARTYGLQAIGRNLLARSLFYGAKSYVATTAAFLNFNLDLVIMPAFLHARSIGFYAVANSVSYVVIGLASSLYGLAMPAAARRGDRGYQTIVFAAYVTMVVAMGTAVPLFVLAHTATSFVYGARFAASVPALQVLLIGSAVVPSTTMWVSGLFAVNRPWSASVAYLSGVITTVVGLALFLRSGGIMAAAWVSTVTYVQVFVVALWMYKRAARLTWAQFVPVRTWFHVNE